MEYKLRKCTENDYAFCHKVTKVNMYHLFCRHWGGWVQSEFRKGFVCENIRIILSSQKPIGYICQKDDGNSVYLDNIQLLPQYQNQGIGTRVLNDFMAEYPKSTTFRLTTFEDNPAKKLYERLGFRVIERKKNGMIMERPAK